MTHYLSLGIPRRSQILQRIGQQGQCSVEELCLKFAVSDMTIRINLHALENSGQVLRTHGGATMSERVAFEFGFMQRVRVNHDAQTRQRSSVIRPVGRCENSDDRLRDKHPGAGGTAARVSGSDSDHNVTPHYVGPQFSEGVDLLVPGGLLRRLLTLCLCPLLLAVK
jgi:hypothetical protein